MKRRSGILPDLYLAPFSPCDLGDGDAVLLRGGQGREQVGERQQVLHLFAEVQELQLAACALGVDVEADEGAQAHAVDVGEVFEVEDEELAAGSNVLQVGVELVGEAGDEASVALDEGGFAFTEDVVTERLGGCFFGHRWLRGGECGLRDDNPTGAFLHRRSLVRGGGSFALARGGCHGTSSYRLQGAKSFVD